MSFLAKGDKVTHKGRAALVTGLQDGGAGGMRYQIHYVTKILEGGEVVGWSKTGDFKTGLRVQDMILVEPTPRVRPGREPRQAAKTQAPGAPPPPAAEEPPPPAVGAE